MDAAEPGDEIVVTNGVYATGGRAVDSHTSRVAADKPLSLHSVNGPEATMILGRQEESPRFWETAIRCVYLASGAWLSGFTLTKWGERLFQLGRRKQLLWWRLV